MLNFVAKTIYQTAQKKLNTKYCQVSHHGGIT